MNIEFDGIGFSSICFQYRNEFHLRIFFRISFMTVVCDLLTSNIAN